MRLLFRVIHIASAVLMGAAFLLAGAVQAPAQVLINEVVTDPQQDWNDSDGGDGVPFNQFTGTGTVTASDEWVELVNLTTATVDLTSWTLEMIDTTPATEVLTSGSPNLVFSFGSFGAFGPAGRVVVGNPAGEMNNNVYLVLRDGARNVVDAVELGTEDFAGDGSLNNTPDGNARAQYDEAVARVPDGLNTGQPQFDFRHTRATIGRFNPRPPPPPVLIINEVVTDPQRDWNDDAGSGDGVAFNDVPGTGTARDTDEWIELVNVSDFPGSILHWTLVMHDTTPATETIGFGGAQYFFERTSALDFILPGEHIVVGNPAGTMNNDIWILLLDAQGQVMDEIELGDQDFRGNGPGDEAPDGNATSALNEAVARLPDAGDTNHDATDFIKQRATIAGPNGSTPVRLWHLYR